MSQALQQTALSPPLDLAFGGFTLPWRGRVAERSERGGVISLGTQSASSPHPGSHLATLDVFRRPSPYERAFTPVFDGLWGG